MSLASNILIQIQQIGELIVEITASQNPTVSVAGRNIGKTEYLHELRDAQKDLMEQYQIALLIDSGPFEVRSRGIT